MRLRVDVIAQAGATGHAVEIAVFRPSSPPFWASILGALILRDFVHSRTAASQDPAQAVAFSSVSSRQHPRIVPEPMPYPFSDYADAVSTSETSACRLGLHPTIYVEIWSQAGPDHIPELPIRCMGVDS